MSSIPKQRLAPGHTVEFELGEFTHKAVEREAAQMGVSSNELMAFAVLYYLADLDSGRIARRIPR